MDDLTQFYLSLKQPPVECEYTWYQDFQIADRIGGKKGVKETYDKAKKYWLDNPAGWGEVVCALNWRLWDLYETQPEIAKLYETLWQEATDLGWKTYKGDKEKESVFFRKID